MAERADRTLLELINIANRGEKRLTITQTALDSLASSTLGYAEVVAAAPSADSDRGIFFFQKDSDGKHQFSVRFPTGAVQILATEP